MPGRAVLDPGWIPVILGLIYFRILQFFKGDQKKLARGTLESPTATWEMNRVKKHVEKKKKNQKTWGPEQWAETLAAQDPMDAASLPFIRLFLSPFITLSVLRAKAVSVWSYSFTLMCRKDYHSKTSIFFWASSEALLGNHIIEPWLYCTLIRAVQAWWRSMISECSHWLGLTAPNQVPLSHLMLHLMSQLVHNSVASILKRCLRCIHY